MRILLSIFFIFIIQARLFSQSPSLNNDKVNDAWAESVFSTLSLKEKIGQLIMVTTAPSQGEANQKRMEQWITEQHIGGVLFLKTQVHELANNAKYYQSISKLPLFIAIDGENGLAFRMDSVVKYPYAMGLGAIRDNSLIYQMGREVGQQCKYLGINLNFAPVADVNSNAQNPVINYRSFGENPMNVAEKSWQFAKGMQDEHILVTAKHFPGHGDTGYDSHHTLPLISKTYDQLKQTELVPFKALVDNGVKGIMTAHINLSAIDKNNLPATLSQKVMTGILRDSLGFSGLVFSDGMNMKGITDHFSESEAAVKALVAGVDVLEFVLNPESVIKAIENAVHDRIISEESINEKCKKVLAAKAWAGIHLKKSEKNNDFISLLNKGQYNLTSRMLHESMITVIQNTDSLLPLQRLDTLRIATIAIGDSAETSFQKMLSNYFDADEYYVGENATLEDQNNTLQKLKNYNLVIGGVHGTHLSASNRFGVTALHQNIVSQIATEHNTILAFFSNPYSLKYFPELTKTKGILVGYGDSESTQNAAAQVIFGAIGANAMLPVGISELYPEGTGVKIEPINRLKYSLPEEVGFDANLLHAKIDSFANTAIKDSIFPGCQILLAKKGRVFFNKSYGYYTYDSIQEVNEKSIYDLASITKIVGPLPWLMKLYEDSIISLDAPFYRYWPDFYQTDKANITLREILAHQAGFGDWLPFPILNSTNRGSLLKSKLLHKKPSKRYPIRVASNLYASRQYKKEMMASIKNYEVDKRKRYHYSDVGFYLFPDVIENSTGKGYNHLVLKDFLQPIGAKNMTFNPYQYFSKDKIVPTEYDDVFRGELVHGFVHDESAALLGGVAGNSGLFSNANDLAKIMQFYLQGGSYGDFKFLKPKTVQEFTKVQYLKMDNRRGLGFDKPYLENGKKKLADAYPAPQVSAESFGHSGYTGTFVWADPKNDLIFIFLSNRVNPSRKNNKIVETNFRPTLQQSIYQLQKSFTYTRY